MANKFTKSILERQAKEAREHPKTAEPTKQPTPEAADTPQQLPPSENTVANEKQAAQPVPAEKAERPPIREDAPLFFIPDIRPGSIRRR